MKKYVHHLKQKPENVRKRIAFGATIGATALIAIVWMVTLASSGALAIGTGKSLIADSATPTLQNNNVPTFKQSVTQLLGAAGAAQGSNASNTPALTIVDKQQNNASLPQPVPNSNNATRLTF